MNSLQFEEPVTEVSVCLTMARRTGKLRDSSGMNMIGEIPQGVA
ncbi:hypothetical protein [Halobacillus seohaensis]